MKNIQLKQRFFLVLLLVSIFSSIGAQTNVGINTDMPTSVLDINGDLRIRKTEMNTSTNDANLVIDSTGIVKRSLMASSFFRGYLTSNFSSEGSGITKVRNFETISESNDDFDDDDNFIPSVTGLYNIQITVSVTMIENESTLNKVLGLVDASTGEWVMRFSIPRLDIESVGLNNPVGVANSFLGAVRLTAGRSYYFGITQYLRLLSNPTGSTGSGIGTYFAIELVKAE